MNFFINRQRMWAILVLAIILLGSIARHEYRAPKRNFCDFHLNYIAGKKMLEKQDLYDFWKYKLANFKYPPFFAMLMMPLGLFPERTANLIWHILNFFLLIFCFRLLRAMLTNTLSYKQKVILYTLVTIVTFRFISENFDEGQVNILMMTASVFGLYCVSKGKELQGAFSLSFSLMVKYMPAIFIPYFMVKKRFKLVGLIFLAILLFLIIPIFVVGFDYGIFLTKRFIPFLFESCMDVNSMSTHPNQSLLALLMRFLYAETESAVNILSLSKSTIMAIFVLIASLLYIFIIIPPSIKGVTKEVKNLYDGIDYGLLFICIALFNPNAWKHAFIFLIPAYMVSIYYLIKTGWKDKLVLSLTFLSFFFTSVTNQFLFKGLPRETFENYSTITFGAIVLFFCLLKLKWMSSGNLLHIEKL